jgi:glycyl-tRNA synthetase
MINLEEFATFCKQKGFVYRSSEIYGGLAGVHDYGFLGAPLKRAILESWWNRFVTKREDLVGIDGAIISAGAVWEASGHTAGFNDPLIQDTVTKRYHRADHLVEDALGIATDGMSVEELARIIEERGVKSPEGNPLGSIVSFNLMFPVRMGANPDTSSIAYLRGETAQVIFAQFRSIYDAARAKLPFGIAQAGKAFRNEISPREFLFRQREFEILEIEYFFASEKPIDFEQLPGGDSFLAFELAFLSAADQESEADARLVRLADLVDAGVMVPIHAYWLAQSYEWFVSLGIRTENLRVREHLENELSHYSAGTFDIEYRFPFGFKEIFGIANRTDYDLKAHQQKSGKSMEVFDDELGRKVLPHVIEPSFGFDRTILAVMLDAYRADAERGNIVLALDAHIAPQQVAVFPLVSNKEPLVALSRTIFTKLLDAGLRVAYDKSGSVGRRYARQDEIGTPYCVTVDFESLEDRSVTVRDRDTTVQERVPIDTLAGWLAERCR